MRIAALALAALLGALPLGAQDADKDKKLQEKVDALASKVGEMLGVTLKKSIPAAYQSREDFGKKVKADLDKEYPPEKLKGITLFYRLLGLVPDDFDFTKTVTDTLAAQAGAYYDPETKKMYVLAGDMPDTFMDGILFHELVHAIQDQEHDLAKRMKDLSEGKNDDAATGFRFLVEGEASFWMQGHMLKAMTGMSLEELPGPALDLALGMTKNTTTKSILQQMDMQAKMMGEQTPSLKESALQLKKTPPILVRSLVDPYLRGMYYAYKLFKDKGKEGFRGMMKDGAAWNTRDMMFADDTLKNPRGIVQVKLADLGAAAGAGWTSVYEDTAGAITLHTLFEDMRAPADVVAKAWDGDRLQLLQNGDSAVLTGHLVFNTDAAATTFAKQLERLYREQWTKGAKIEEKDGVLVAGGKDYFVVETKGSKAVFARGGAPAGTAALREALWKSQSTEVKRPAGARKDY